MHKKGGPTSFEVTQRLERQGASQPFFQLNASALRLGYATPCLHVSVPLDIKLLQDVAFYLQARCSSITTCKWQYQMPSICCMLSGTADQ